MDKHLAIVLAAVVVLAGCASSDTDMAAPSRVVPRYHEGAATLPPHYTGCVVNSIYAATGEIKALVSPPVMIIHLYSGSCALPGPLLVKTAGTLSYAAPEGRYYIAVENPTDEAIPYSYRVDYLGLSGGA